MRSGWYTPYHKRVGAALGCDAEVEEISVRCGCGREQREVVELDASLAAQLREMSCASCGRLGDMRMVAPMRRVS